MVVPNKNVFSAHKGKRARDSDQNGGYHFDPSVHRHEASSSFHALCSGCPHIINNLCVYCTCPRLRKFPCFFRENVAPGGWDGEYGATVNNHIKPSKK